MHVSLDVEIWLSPPQCQWSHQLQAVDYIVSCVPARHHKGVQIMMTRRLHQEFDCIRASEVRYRGCEGGVTFPAMSVLLVMKAYWGPVLQQHARLSIGSYIATGRAKGAAYLLTYLLTD